MKGTRRRLMQALRTRDPKAWLAALAELDDLEERQDNRHWWEPVNVWVEEYMPYGARKMRLRLRGQGEEFKPETSNTTTVDRLYRILSAGVRCCRGPAPEFWLHTHRAVVSKSRVYVPRWAIWLDPDVKRMKKIKNDIEEQKVQTVLAILREEFRNV